MQTPQQRDRTVQVFLAQARGPVRNGDLLRQSVDLMLRLRADRAGGKRAKVMDNALIETLSAVVEALEAEGIPHAVTGSVASSVHGEPQMTQDVDLLVLASADRAAAVATRLRPRFYAPEDMLRKAASEHGFANVVDGHTGLKADLSFAAAAGFPAAVLRRRVRCRIGADGPEFWLVTPEDVILMKLLWRKDTRSNKQWDNALGVTRVKGAMMDWAYLFEQARELEIEEDLVHLRNEAGI